MTRQTPSPHRTEFDCSECDQHVILREPVPGLTVCPDCFLKVRRERMKTHPERLMAIGMCPDCGSFRLSVPGDDGRRIEATIDITDMMFMVGQLIGQIEYFTKGQKHKIHPDVFLDVPCCQTQH